MLRRRPVMRMAATTAVVAGTATAVSGGVRRHQEAKAEQQQAAAAAEAGPPAYAEAPPEASPRWRTPMSSSRSWASSMSRGYSPTKNFPPRRPSCWRKQP